MTEFETSAIEERKRYSTRLRRRAQAHVTAELGQDGPRDDLDRQITMVLQHALESTNAHRVTLFRPPPKGHRWSSVTLFADGAYFYGPIEPAALLLPMLVQNQKSALLLGPDHAPPDAVSLIGDLSRAFGGASSTATYLGLPLLVGSTVTGVLEVVDVAQTDKLQQYAESIGLALQPLAVSLMIEARPRETQIQPKALAPSAAPAAVGGVAAIVPHLLARPNLNPGADLTITAEEWLIISSIDGVRNMAAIAATSETTLPQAKEIAARLIRRGLLRIEPGDRRD
ncbi:MAG: hypothetical protein M3R06_04170 [Chloroflexota bacterium]|nr:hypothetical protein [Chloroflexota bacterium]